MTRFALGQTPSRQQKRLFFEEKPILFFAEQISMNLTKIIFNFGENMASFLFTFFNKTVIIRCSFHDGYLLKNKECYDYEPDGRHRFPGTQSPHYQRR